MGGTNSTKSSEKKKKDEEIIEPKIEDLNIKFSEKENEGWINYREKIESSCRVYFRHGNWKYSVDIV